jgi:hypothetical protein
VVKKFFIFHHADGKRTAKFPLSSHSKSDTFKTGGSKMAAKVKPVQPTEIRDKKIAFQVIEQIRKPIPASVYRRQEKLKQTIEQMTRK